MENHSNAYTRRKMLGALGLTLAAGIPAGVSAAPAAARPDTAGAIYPDVASLQADKKLKTGAFAQTAGYHKPGDGGGALYLVGAEGQVNLENGLKAALVPGTAVNYRMFGAVCDGVNDDGVQIKAAHAFANQHHLPVVQTGGEFWLKQTNGIQIQNSVQWGQTIFHIDEQYNVKNASRFEVISREKPRQVEVDKAVLLNKLKPGVLFIPELAPYTNCLVFAVDEKDRIGLRAGYGGQSWAREDFFYVEEHGRIIGDLAWEFKDFTSLMAYPCEQSWLTIEGGTFLLSGNNPGKADGKKYDGYWRGGISITRSRTVVREQWVGLEPGATDISMNPRAGFYTLTRVFDVALEDVRLIPYEQDREGTARDVPAGTYGISCGRTLKARFTRVTAEGGPVHWGVFGTNLNKNFIIDDCALNRVDVHFHCWHLYVRNSRIGYRGITVTGGGDLFVENTTIAARTFISFRPDFGAKWDGDIVIRNCKLIPATNGETGILEFVPQDFTYNYPVGFGRTLRVEGLTIDFRSVPGNADGKVCWLMRMAKFSRMSNGERMFFPQTLVFKDIVVEGRETGVRLIQLPTPQDFRQSKKGGVKDGLLQANATLLFENVQLEPLTEGVHLLVNASPGKPAMDEYALFPEVRIVNCPGVSVNMRGDASLRIERSEVNTLQAALNGELSLDNCHIRPVLADEKAVVADVSGGGGASFTNCVLHAPVVNGRAVPSKVDDYGFIRLNKQLKFNHLNTRLAPDALGGRKLSPAFVGMLKSHHELERDTLS
ncbi:hypothetical protein ACWKWU_00120 [Chitinophaga lutea]